MKNNKVLLLLILLCTTGFAQVSPFADGYWVKIKVERSGVYKFNTDTLKSWGFSNPENISIFTTLPYSLSYQDKTPRSLLEIPIEKIENESENYFATYLRGVNFQQRYNSNHYEGLFDNTISCTYYFIKQNDTTEEYLEIDSLPEISDTVTTTHISRASLTSFNMINETTVLDTQALHYAPNFLFSEFKSPYYDTNICSIIVDGRDVNDTLLLEINDTQYLLFGEIGYSINMNGVNYIKNVSISNINPVNEIRLEYFSFVLYMSNAYWGVQCFFCRTSDRPFR